ncbi:hypothetical protein EK904_000562 [Melospiza melodia maxima]|nr:hypothetical protein EK904_000562 [Melospiza melodia maxima]
MKLTLVLLPGNELVIFLADQKEPYFKPRVKLPMKSLGVTITSVVPGDYDGDSQMDVLLTTQAPSHGKDELSVFIFWGHNQTLEKNPKCWGKHNELWGLEEESEVKNSGSGWFVLRPLASFNGDLIPDVFGVTSDSSKPQILLGGNHCVLAQRMAVEIAGREETKKKKTDLFLTTSPNSKTIQFETWVNKEELWAQAEPTQGSSTSALPCFVLPIPSFGSTWSFVAMGALKMRSITELQKYSQAWEFVLILLME